MIDKPGCVSPRRQCNPQHAFDRLSGAVERILARWWGFAAYVGLGALCGLRWGEPASNIYATYVTAMLVPLFANVARRGSMAVQAKVDTITSGDALDRIEERGEREIEAARSERGQSV